MKSSGTWFCSLFFAARAFAAPCCGGGQGQAALILGDERAIASVHYLFSKTVIDALDDGTYLERDASLNEHQHSFVLDGSYLWSDRWQTSGRLALIDRSVAYDPESPVVGLGDAVIQTTFEALPEIRYSKAKPRVFVSTQLTVPLGDSPWEAARPASSMSRGFVLIGFGAMAFKRWNDWDASATGEFHRGFSRAIDLSDRPGVNADPGFGSTFGASVGYRFPFGLRLGAALSYALESGTAFDDPGLPDGSTQRFASTSILAGYGLGEDWTVSAVYTDQTLVGAARNVSLQRIVGMSIQRSFSR